MFYDCVCIQYGIGVFLCIEPHLLLQEIGKYPEKMDEEAAETETLKKEVEEESETPSEETIAKIKDGFMQETVGTLTVGDVYLMVDNCNLRFLGFS